MALTNVQIKQIKPKDKDFKVFDERGLFCLIKKNGAKYWRFRYSFGGKEKSMAFGVYPEVSLKEARERRDKARLALRDDEDPMAERKRKRFLHESEGANHFEAVALEWFDKEKDNWKDTHIKKQKGLLDKNLIPYLGSIPVNEITPPILLQCLRKVEERGALETARRTKQVSGQIFRYAVATGRTDRDPSYDLRGALKAPKRGHFAAITEPKAFGELLRAIDGFTGSFIVKTALQLAPLLFVRPGELRHMEWLEIDFDKAEWRIPASKMKMNQPHIVPLATQSLDLLREIQALTGKWTYVFTGERSRKRCMSDNALNAAIRRLGYTKEEHTTHGFRASARTLLDEELCCEVHLIEHQLAHEVKDALGRAYNRTKHLPQRAKMMQRWADYLDRLRAM